MTSTMSGRLADPEPKVTLESLRADWETAKRELIAHSDRDEGRATKWLYKPFDLLLTPTRCAGWEERGPFSTALVKAAKLYDVGRKHGLQAAMLWKLQNGGAQ